MEEWQAVGSIIVADQKKKWSMGNLRNIQDRQTEQIWVDIERTLALKLCESPLESSSNSLRHFIDKIDWEFSEIARKSWQIKMQLGLMEVRQPFPVGRYIAVDHHVFADWWSIWCLDRED
jgi:hypothetical protein